MPRTCPSLPVFCLVGGRSNYLARIVRSYKYPHLLDAHPKRLSCKHGILKCVRSVAVAIRRKSLFQALKNIVLISQGCSADRDILFVSMGYC
jgi:hypothetical protein